jgi:hypothetical protein
MAESYFRSLYESRNPDLRAGDEDREAVADILREQHIAGRLDTDELQERLDRCFAAKTYGELHELVADLPGPEPRREGRRIPARPKLVLVPLLALVIAAAVVSNGHLLWLAIPLFFFAGRPLLWGRGLGWGFSGGCGPRGSSRPGSYV